jgi:hypothetical protein
MSKAYDKATRFFDEAFAELGLDEDGPHDPDEAREIVIVFDLAETFTSIQARQLAAVRIAAEEMLRLMPWETVTYMEENYEG